MAETFIHGMFMTMKNWAKHVLAVGAHRALSVPVLVGALAMTGSLQAQAPSQPVITSVFPPAAQIGAETEIAIVGTDLDDAAGLQFSATKATSKPKLVANKSPEPGKFVVGVPADAATGMSDLRLAGRLGISNPRGFFFSKLPVVVVPGAANTAATAFKGKVDTVYAGKAVKNAAAYITLDVEKGRRLFVVCRPSDFDSRMEAAVTVSDATGRVLERLKPDGILDITPADTGTFTLKVSDLMFRGGDDYAYCVVVTTAPLVEAIFTDGQIATLYGRNLPGGAVADGLARFGKPLERVQLPAEQAKGLITSSVVAPARFGPETKAASGDAAAPEALTLPAKFAGWFPARGKARMFTFEARKGETCVIEVHCSRQGLAADPFLVVEKISKDADGKETYATVGEVYDAESITAPDELGGVFRDPSYRFEVKEDGRYRVQVRDLFCNSPASPRHPFELGIQKEGVAFELVTFPVVLPKAKAARTADFGISSLWRGGLVAMKVVALRKQGFAGPIQLKVENLPAGVTAICGIIPQGGTSGYVVFKADESAPAWSGSIRVSGTAQKDGQPVSELASLGATLVWKVADSQKEPVLTRLTRDIALAVDGSDLAPVTLEAALPGNLEVTVGGKCTIPFKVLRRGDAADAFKVKVVGVGTPATVPEIDVPAKAADGKLEIDTAALKLPVGEHQVLLQGSTKFKHRRGAPEAQAADEELKKISAEAAAMATAAKAAAEAVTKAPKEQLADAEKAAKEAAEKQKQMEQRKTEADKRAKDLNAKAAPKDAVFVLYSNPMTLLVKEAPKK